MQLMHSSNVKTYCAYHDIYFLFEAGLVSEEFPDQLIIALDPEVASIYCRRLKQHQTLPEVPRYANWMGYPPGCMNKDPAVDDHVEGRTRYI